MLVEAIGFRGTFLVTASIKLASWLAVLALYLVQRSSGMRLVDWKDRG